MLREMVLRFDLQHPELVDQERGRISGRQGAHDSVLSLFGMGCLTDRSPAFTGDQLGFAPRSVVRGAFRT
jgi:hypothetical protein